MSVIVGVGSYVPEKILSNQDLESMVDTTDEWIFTRTGMKERRIAAANESAADMGAESAERALASAEVQPDEIDMIIAATMTPDHFCPSTAALIQADIGAKNAGVFDLQAACSGYIYALSVANAYVESGQCKTVLVVATEKMSAFMNYEDRSSCILFGDGASAFVVKKEGPGLRVGNISVGGSGEDAALIIVPAGGSRLPSSPAALENKLQYLTLQGSEVFKKAVRRMSDESLKLLEASNLSIDDIRFIVPHQANQRITDAVVKRLGIPSEKAFSNIDRYGNTSAASIGLALDELLQKEGVRRGEKLLLVAFGGGLTWGVSILEAV